MVDLRPIDLPRLRDDLIAFTNTQAAVGLRELDMEDGRMPRGDIPASLHRDATALAAAELFYLTPEMVDLAAAAARSLPAFTLTADDVPTPNGLMYFARPVEDTDDADPTLEVTAVWWQTTGQTILLSTLVERDAVYGQPWWWSDRTRAMFPPIFTFGTWRAPVLPNGTAKPVRSDDGVRGGGMLATVKTMWLLMRQPLASDTPAVYDRTARRRFQREGRQPPPVRVIALRHPPGSPSSGGGGDREWHHRWIVRGHWRMQPWGPRRELTRPVWIAPYPKGPEGAPLLGGEKVYIVKADPS